ncbi:MAG TPA: DUF6112 family protein [Acidimicrobiales bacterium]|nr:DUF6112 family protein [Acidimicrobiales bacterium]
MLCALWLLAGGDPSPVTIQPIATNLPGSAVLGGLADGLDFWALLAAVVGLIVGAVMWAFGHYGQNYHQAYNGRKGVLVSGLAALLIGAAPHIIGFFVGQGHGVQP